MYIVKDLFWFWQDEDDADSKWHWLKPMKIIRYLDHFISTKPLKYTMFPISLYSNSYDEPEQILLAIKLYIVA